MLFLSIHFYLLSHFFVLTHKKDGGWGVGGVINILVEGICQLILLRIPLIYF